VPADRTTTTQGVTVSRRSDARRNRERVLAAAQEVFATRGLDTQMDEVAARAGVGLGTVYRHFPTKAALAATLIADSFDIMASAAQDAINGSDAGQAALEDALRMTLRILETNAGARAAMNSPVNTEHAEVLTALENFLGKLQEALAWAQADGTVRADITAQDLGMILCGISSAIDSRSYSGWERHLALLIDGVRLPAAHMPLPPARE
jgi:AcrR family transcriptional regulator